MKSDEILTHNVLWKIDWNANAVTPTTTVWRKTAPNMIEEPNASGLGGSPMMVTAKNGRQYMWSGAQFKSIVLRRDGDLFKPFAATIQILHGWELYGGQGIPLLDDKQQYANGSYFWQDANDDQTVQANEVVRSPNALDSGAVVNVDADLNLYLKTGHILRPQRVTDNGQPIYDVAKFEETKLIAHKAETQLPYAYLSFGPEGDAYTYASLKGPSLSKWLPDGTRQWTYPNIPDWRSSLNLPITGPGRLWGMTGNMGVTDKFMAYMTYFGVNHVFSSDGVYVAALLYDGRVSGPESDVGQPEGQSGQFVKLNIQGKDQYFIIHGGQDTRVWEVLGLDTVQPLAGGTYEHTAASAEMAAASIAEYTAKIQRQQQLTIVRGRTALDLAQPISAAVDSDRKFEVRAAYDADNLYLRYDVTTPYPLVNSMADPTIIFHGGNAIDVQLATDLKADPKRKTPAPGDLRLVITQQNGKPMTMVYRPRVAGFAGERIVLTSPTGQEPFDRIEPTDKVMMTTSPIDGGFRAAVTIPFALLGMEPKAGEQIRMDLGFIFSRNANGSRVSVREYWKNNSFTANVTDDIPHESRLEPNEWGTATFE